MDSVQVLPTAPLRRSLMLRVPRRAIPNLDRIAESYGTTRDKAAARAIAAAITTGIEPAHVEPGTFQLLAITLPMPIYEATSQGRLAVPYLIGLIGMQPEAAKLRSYHRTLPTGHNQTILTATYQDGRTEQVAVSQRTYIKPDQAAAIGLIPPTAELLTKRSKMVKDKLEMGQREQAERCGMGRGSFCNYLSGKYENVGTRYHIIDTLNTILGIREPHHTMRFYCNRVAGIVTAADIIAHTPTT